MTSWRSKRILDLVSQTKIDSENQELGDSDRKGYEEMNKSVEIEKENQENVFTESNLVTEVQETAPIQELLVIEKKYVSLVPDYSSDATLSENENTGKNHNPKLDDHASNASENLLTSANHSKSSRSSSSSSSRSSSSSSDSSGSSSSGSSNSNRLTRKQNASLQIVQTEFEENRPSCSGEGQQRECRNNSVANYNISPIYTDQSDVDLSDDDPTIDFNTLFQRPVKRSNFLFNEASASDSDCSTEENSRRGRKRMKNIEKWQQNKAKRLRNKGETYISMAKSRKMVPGSFIKDSCTEKCKLKCAEKVSSDNKILIF